MAAPSTGIYLAAEWLLLSNSSLSNILINSGNALTGEVVQRGSDVIYEEGNFVTYNPDGAIKITISNVVYTLIKQDKVIFSTQPLS